MIAEGIQNPTTGEIVKVQGAGTVYNEEKNSLALGKGTSAIGQDQFVFGRYNEEDANKAEIVGGAINIEIPRVQYTTQSVATSDGKVMQYGKILEALDESEWPDYGEGVEYDYSEEIYGFGRYLSGCLKRLRINKEHSSYITSDWDSRIKSIYVLNTEGEDYKFAFDLTSKNITVGDTIVYCDSSIFTTKSIAQSVDFENTVEVDSFVNMSEDETDTFVGKKYLYLGYAYTDDIDRTSYFGNISEQRSATYLVRNGYSYARGIHTFFVKKVADNAREFSEWLGGLLGISPQMLQLEEYYSNYSNCKYYFEQHWYNNSPTNARYFLLVTENGEEMKVGAKYHNVEINNPLPGIWVRSSQKNGFDLTYICGEVAKNIRTLDWEGNQWNAGDVTCDDGEGNTISLRDLAANKANVYETENIEALDGTIIEKLKAGDIIIKKGENSNHAYRVSFKNATGMCLTYADAENVETIAYDKTGDTWAKTDKTVTGITGKADANHNHDTAYAALNHNHDDAYAAKTHSHAIADVTGLQAALDNKMRAQKSLKITYASATQTFAIDSAQSAALNSFTDSVPENTWIPVRIELYEDSTKEGDVFGFAMWELAGQDDEYDVTVMINNVKFFTFAQESSQTFTFDSWTKSFIGQSFFS